MATKPVLVGGLVAFAALAVGFIIGRLGSPERVVVRTVTVPAEPARHPPAEQVPSPPTVSKEEAPKDAPPPARDPAEAKGPTADDAPAVGPDGRKVLPYGGFKGKPGLFQVEIRREEDRFLDGFHDAIPTVEQVDDIVSKEGEPAYVERLVGSRLRALQLILGDEWSPSGVEPETRRFYEEWSRKKWGIHRDYAEAVRGAADDEARQTLRLAWAKKWSEMLLDQQKEVPTLLGRERYGQHEAKIDKVLQYEE